LDVGGKGISLVSMALFHQNLVQDYQDFILYTKLRWYSQINFPFGKRSRNPFCSGSLLPYWNLAESDLANIFQISKLLIVMETGGMKGREGEIARSPLIVG